MRIFCVGVVLLWVVIRDVFAECLSVLPMYLASSAVRGVTIVSVGRTILFGDYCSVLCLGRLLYFRRVFLHVMPLDPQSF